MKMAIMRLGAWRGVTMAAVVAAAGILAFGAGVDRVYADESANKSLLNAPDARYRVSFEAELGFVGVLNHTYQSGADGTAFDFREQGGQDILSPFTRFAAEVRIGPRHAVELLYQPLELVTRAQLREDITIDTVTFAAGGAGGGTGERALNVRYSFPFWRGTYYYNVIAEPGLELGLGGALQLRNASIGFESGDGTQIAISQNLGPVVAAAVRGGKYWPGGLFARGEVVGIYASSAFINGADYEFEGSLLDASVQVGVALNGGAETYLKLRFLGGSAQGTSENVGGTWSESIEGYTENRLATTALTLGLRLR